MAVSKKHCTAEEKGAYWHGVFINGGNPIKRRNHMADNSLRQQDSTQGSIFGKLLRFMLPILGARILQAMCDAVDLLFVAVLGMNGGGSCHCYGIYPGGERGAVPVDYPPPEGGLLVHPQAHPALLCTVYYLHINAYGQREHPSSPV